MTDARAEQDGPKASPVVSVLVITYNHERFIEAAMRSVLAQQTSFPYEVVVAEDRSVDGTRTVLDRLSREFPGRFKVLERPQNLGLSRNLEDGLRHCRGRYISLLEGDDEWIDPHKLARVAAALDAHPAWSGCFHACRVERLDQPGRTEILPQRALPESIGFDEILRRNCIPTYSTVTYRRGLVDDFPPWHRRLSCGDWGLHLLHAVQGPLGYLPEAMTRYRVHAGGMWSGKPLGDRWYETLAAWAVFDTHFQWRYSDQIAAALSEYLAEINRQLADWQRIERRYHALGLDRIAAMLRGLKFWRRSDSGDRPAPPA